MDGHTKGPYVALERMRRFDKFQELTSHPPRRTLQTCSYVESMRDSKHPRDAKVADKWLSSIRYEHIIGFDIRMDNTLVMQVLQPFSDANYLAVFLVNSYNDRNASTYQLQNIVFGMFFHVVQRRPILHPF